jgi:hypothetical protein
MIKQIISECLVSKDCNKCPYVNQEKCPGIK